MISDDKRRELVCELQSGMWDAKKLRCTLLEALDNLEVQKYQQEANRLRDIADVKVRLRIVEEFLKVSET